MLLSVRSWLESLGYLVKNCRGSTIYEFVCFRCIAIIKRIDKYGFNYYDARGIKMFNHLSKFRNIFILQRRVDIGGHTSISIQHSILN